jgi:hypothetical protein
VFRKFTIEAIVGGAAVALPGQQLTVIRGLYDIFNLNRFEREWKDKGQFAAFRRAIRFIQADELIPAVYDLVTSGIVSIGQGLGIERSTTLENLREEHVEWLQMINDDLAKQYQDIAAMTALVYPFINEVRRKLSGDANKQRIEVRKAIERTDDAYQLMYTVGPIIAGRDDDREYQSVRVFLNRNADTYFMYDQLIAKFNQATHLPPEDRVKGKGESVLLTFGDIETIYDQVLSAGYPTEKERREFTYKLKLSLAARFAQFYEKKDSEKE